MKRADTIPPESIKRIPIFSACSQEELSAVASSLEWVDLSAGEVVFGENDPGDDMYIVAAGQIRIVSDVGTEKVVFAHLGPGEFFGEMALVTGAPRSAAAIATTDSRLWRLSKTGFEEIQKNHPEVDTQIGRVLADRVHRGNVKRFENEAFTFLTLAPERPEITIGRLPDNDLVINDPQVAAVHARVSNMEGRWVIYDQDSATGTYVNRRRIKVAELQDGDEILIGTNKVFLDGLMVKGFVGREGVRIDVLNLTKALGDGRRILDDISLSIYPGEFVAIVGGSGAGKTSLLHALNGFSPATAGAVYYDGISLYENSGLFRSILGYVPQDDIVHGELTVERTLYYGAKLRLPPDTREEEIAERIDEVLGSLGLTERRQTEVKRLSGGQRKRVSLALELLARPKALYLDEPTSGLDPALEGRMMALFRDVAESGATVIVSTHVTQNLRMCDRIAWLAPGGHLVFFGSPSEALRHFRVQDYGEIYSLLETPDDRERWSAVFVDSPAFHANVSERIQTFRKDGSKEGETATVAPTAPAPAPASPLRQLFWLTLRYAEVLARDTTHLALLLIQAPAIALALLILFGRDIFAATIAEGGDALRAAMALHIMTASAIWLGASNAAREITKESAIYARERLVNLSVLPYVMSKVLVLAVLCLFQTAALVGIFVIRIDLGGLGTNVYLGLLAAIFLTELAGLALGLLVSAAVANSDRAMAIVPVLLIPQIIFAGALVPLDQMLAPARAVAQVMISKWSFQLTGGITDLAPRFSEQLPPSIGGPYASQFDTAMWLPWVVLVGFTVGMLAAAVAVQKRKDIS